MAAQWELEKSKHDANHLGPSSGNNFLSFLFGTATDESSSAADAPVFLTPEERRALEAINNTALTQQPTAGQGTSQSVELQFVLESVVMDILTRPGRPIVSLQMGRASIALTSKADGSVSCAYRLSILKIVDSVTVDTIFPNLCRPKDKEQNDIVTFQHDFLWASVSEGASFVVVLRGVRFEVHVSISLDKATTLSRELRARRLAFYGVVKKDSHTNEARYHHLLMSVKNRSKVTEDADCVVEWELSIIGGATIAFCLIMFLGCSNPSQHVYGKESDGLGTIPGQ